jgi:polysaccharide biosynthesis/export protein
MPIKITTLVFAVAIAATTQAQQKPAPPVPNGGAAKPPAGGTVPVGVPTPPDYVIGPDDLLTIVFWRDKDMSSDVAVRPDGQITLPLLNDVTAAGLTPEQLREKLMIASAKYVTEPNVTVVVKAINSRKVSVMGMVGKTGPYPLTGPTTVMQMLAMAGGVHEFADTKKIKILRKDAKGVEVALSFNYKDVIQGKNLKQNIELKPGDIIIVP